MSQTTGEITHVSDTALLVAAVRAHETEMEDAFFCDPFAARLAGERGFAFLNATTDAQILRYGLAVRTRFLDELLTELLATNPIDTVLSVGCGLDTRPWRLDLPPNLRWIEVDFAAMLDYKERLMEREAPRCRRERLVADVNDPSQRRAIYQIAGVKPALLITEGLLMYLPGATVESLVAEVRDQSSVTHWIIDFATSAFMASVAGDTALKSVRHVQASDSLKSEQIFDAFRNHGWTTVLSRSYIHDAGFANDRVRQMMGDKPAPPLPAHLEADPSGVHCLARR